MGSDIIVKMTEAKSPLTDLLSRSAALSLFVMLRRTVDDSHFADNVEAHIAWMIEKEREGKIFLSGPTIRGKSGNLDGLTILSCADLPEANAIASDDPLISSGCVQFELYPWTAYEGSIHLSISLSDSHMVMR